MSSFGDGTAATWTTLEYGTNPTVGYAVCLNHPGGTGTVGTVNLSSGRSIGYIHGVELTGGTATIDDAPAGTTGTNPTLTYTSTGDGTGFAVTGYYSGSGITPTSPAALETSAHSYSGYWKLNHTGAGAKSMATTGGSGNTVSLVVVIKDAAPAAPTITGPAAAPVSLGLAATLAIAASLSFTVPGVTLDASPLAPLAINATGALSANVSSGVDFEIQPPIVIGTGTNATLGITAALQYQLAGVNKAPTGPLAIAATLGITASISTSNVASLPATFSRARQYKVNPDEHLDAYAIQNQFVLVWEKDPDSVLDYSLDWSDWLAEIPDDAITNMSVALSSGLSVPAYGVVNGGLTAIMAAAGVVGVMEQATIHIVTDAGRVDERTIQLLIRQR